MTTVNPFIFRDYDIRGLVDQDLNEDVYELMGKAFGTIMAGGAASGAGKRVIVGRDVRLSSDPYAKALIKGVRSTGCDVVDVSEVPTPVMYFAVKHFQTDGGMSVTASHNPPQFNGLKMRKKSPTSTLPFAKEDIQLMLKTIQGGVFATGEGGYSTGDAITPYIDYVLSRIQLERPLKVVLDGGNGVAGPTFAAIIQRLGCDFTGLYIEPDGTFPNHIADPIVPANMRDLQAKVRDVGADVGLALDGDGDRIGVVDDSGQIVWADQFLMLLARRTLATKKVPIVFDVKCSMALIEDIQRHGGTPIMWKTGYPNIGAKRAEVGAGLSGEFSGHIFFDDQVIDNDDGTFAGSNLLAYVSTLTEPLSSQLVESRQFASTPEERVHCADAEKFNVIEQVRANFKQEYETIDVDGVRVVFPDGWALIRASNTEPSLTMRFEARTAPGLDRIEGMVKGYLHTIPAIEWGKGGH